MALFFAIIFFVTSDILSQIGQSFFIGFQGTTLTGELKAFLQEIKPGGIIFFKQNIKNKKQIKKLIKDINNCLEIKPFIAVDQEGGRVERLRKICTSIPSPYELAKRGLNWLLKAQNTITKELLELGFNMNLAPVLDINSNPKNPIIGKRAISNDPKIVADYGSKIIKLYLKNKIIPVAKHFPGHGDLDIDSHLDLPVLSKSFNELSSFELIPFKSAIKNKVPVIMIGHIQVPALEPRKDKKIPASLSKNIIKKLLKKKLNYKGLVITDELNMRGVTKNYPLEKAAYKAILADADMLLFNNNEEKTIKAFQYIKEQALKNKKLARRIKESYQKITKTKKRLLRSD